MQLSKKHIKFENDCRQMFVGQIIRSVLYGELKYFADEDGNNINPKPYYKTKYQDIDTLDHSIYFKTDNKTIYLYWDNTFNRYGVSSKLIDFDEKTNNYEQKWDVSKEEKWNDCINQKIIELKIIWEDTWSSNLDGSNKKYYTYPQTFEIKLENDIVIYITASELKDDFNDEYYSDMDNLLVTLNYDLLKELQEKEKRAIEKYIWKKPFWKNIFK